MKVCVVGCGAAGLAAARRSLQFGHQVVVYERNAEIGGTWVYCDHAGIDETDGLPVHTSMYQGLRTNLPKEVMGFPDFSHTKHGLSYISQEEILSFLNSYADHFELRPNIKVNHLVEKIQCKLDNTWLVSVRDKQTNRVTEDHFDAVMVCNGHYHTPHLPDIVGKETFRGNSMHSHDYRNPRNFGGQKVLVVGAGPSGMDIALQISQYAEMVYLSHRGNEKINTIFPENLVLMTSVVKINENSITFSDDMEKSIDVIVYCTGYNYSFPFLDTSCKITVDDNRVFPVYKHLINIEKPTMCFIGLPFYVCAFQMFDLQARFFLKTLSGELQLPPKEQMLADEEQEAKDREKMGLTKRQYHMMGPSQGAYYETLAKLACLDPLPPVLTKIHNDSSQRFTDDLVNFRSDRYEIIDDNTFVRV